MALNPSDAQPTVKLFYRIGEVAELVGVEPHVLRFWETEFRTIRPQKSRKGQRIYSRRDVDKLLRVKELLYGQGFTIAGARKRLREAGLEPAAPGDPAERMASKMRQALVDLRGEVAGLLEELEEFDREPDPGSNNSA
ncbi:MAG: MerR family transcriptional regulator [Polyangiaceae bacterium]|nr:MerR family transcriptional regulator [Polyangiaceae bacterium]